MKIQKTIIACIAALLTSLNFAAADSSALKELAHPSLIGSWAGQMVRGLDDTSLTFTFAEKDGEYTAALTNSALGVYGMPADSVRVEGNSVFIRIARIDVEFSGNLRFDSSNKVNRIDGDWFQKSEMVPVVLQRAE